MSVISIRSKKLGPEAGPQSAGPPATGISDRTPRGVYAPLADEAGPKPAGDGVLGPRRYVRGLCERHHFAGGGRPNRRRFDVDAEAMGRRGPGPGRGGPMD